MAGAHRLLSGPLFGLNSDGMLFLPAVELNSMGSEAQKVFFVLFFSVSLLPISLIVISPLFGLSLLSRTPVDVPPHHDCARRQTRTRPEKGGRGRG